MKIVCIGDSITWGFPFGPEYSWVYQLEKSLEAEVINEGINGNTTSQMWRRFEHDVIKQRPSHVIIMGGA
ncbi:MAG: GDSL-type esterase/lipase family protein, partial [Syntrophomonadaceae bacterium]|nr:GDSL-type esterase/lipase family protein [Syntrophomonadaceae bacterium]